LTKREMNGSLPYVPPGEGKSFWLTTGLYTLKAVGEETDGAFALSELRSPPGAGGRLHIHHREDESYYVLEGEFEFLKDGHTFTAGAGSFVHLPKGRPHMHRNAGDTPARALVLATPAGQEKFFEEAGVPATEGSTAPAPPGPQEVERILAIAQKYGQEVLPPPA
jgi:quercetin dioxygenase-like cupin family protein